MLQAGRKGVLGELASGVIGSQFAPEEVSTPGQGTKGTARTKKGAGRRSSLEKI